MTRLNEWDVWEGLNPARQGEDGVHRVLSTNEQHREMLMQPHFQKEADTKAQAEELQRQAERRELLRQQAVDSERKFSPEGTPEGLERK